MNMKKQMVALAALLTLACAVRADDITCALTGGWGSFTDGNTWVGGVAPGANDNAVFGSGAYGLAFYGTPSCANAYVDNGAPFLGVQLGPWAGNGWLISNRLVIGPTPGSAGSVFMQVGRDSGGTLIVTNAAGTAEVVVGQGGYGLLWLFSGNAIFDNLLVTNGANSSLQLRDCNLTTLHGAAIDANGDFRIGNGGTGEITTWNMKGGAHTIYNGHTYFGLNGDNYGRGKVIVSGVGTVFTNTSLVWMGLYHGGSSLVVSNGAAEVNHSVIEMGIYGANISGENRDNHIIVTGSGSLLQSADYIRVGGGGINNGITVADGGTVTVGSRATWMGGDANAGGTNYILVTGAGSLFHSVAGVQVGYSNKGNTLTVTDGGEARLGSSVIGLNETSTDNQILVSGGTLNITGKGVSLDVRRGALVLNSGTANLTSLLANSGAASKVSFNGGTLAVNGTTVNNGAVFSVGNGVDAATLDLVSGTHAFNDGLVINTNGALVVNGTNAIGSATITANLTLRAGSRLNWTMNSGSQDAVTVSGTLTLDGPVTVALTSLDAADRHTIPMITATGGIVGNPSDWPQIRVNGQRYEAIVSGNTLSMRKAPNGTTVILR